jgi:hypothetical protein
MSRGALLRDVAQIQDFDTLLRNAGARGNPDLVKGALTNAISKSLDTSGTTTLSSNLQEINLDALVKHVYPIQTPALNMGLIGMTGGQSGDSRKYRAITEINSTNLDGIAVEASDTQTGRGATFSTTTLSREKFFSKIMNEKKVSRELAQLSGALRAYAQQTIASIAEHKILQEQHFLFSRRGTIANPSGIVATPSAAGGTLATDTYDVKVSALNYWGQRRFAAAQAVGDLPVLAAGARPSETIATISAGVAVTGPTGSIAISWANVPSAWGYAIYLNDGVSDFLVGLAFAPAFTAINLLFNGFTISAAPLAPTINASQLGSSGKAVGYDGLESQLALDPDVPGYVLALNATPLTTTTGGSGISQIENVLEFLFRVRGVSPKCVFVNSQDWQSISALLTTSTAQNYRVNVDSGAGARVAAGVVVEQIKNQYSRDVLDVVIHPLQPKGKMIFYTADLPYENNNTGTNLTHFFNEQARQVFFAKTEDVAEPGPWGISSIGATILTWPRACAEIVGFTT